mmetsp:Transcript_63179/g.142473  ORF Transcript_63179/g.142473 Transcript_63179/m.142473 type:complete len:411 (+) Transcript_63179:128-1360(+)
MVRGGDGHDVLARRRPLVISEAHVVALGSILRVIEAQQATTALRLLEHWASVTKTSLPPPPPPPRPLPGNTNESLRACDVPEKKQSVVERRGGKLVVAKIDWKELNRRLDQKSSGHGPQSIPVSGRHPRGAVVTPAEKPANMAGRWKGATVPPTEKLNAQPNAQPRTSAPRSPRAENARYLNRKSEGLLKGERFRASASRSAFMPPAPPPPSNVSRAPPPPDTPGSPAASRGGARFSLPTSPEERRAQLEDITQRLIQSQANSLGDALDVVQIPSKQGCTNSCPRRRLLSAQATHGGGQSSAGTAHSPLPEDQPPSSRRGGRGASREARPMDPHTIARLTAPTIARSLSQAFKSGEASVPVDLPLFRLLDGTSLKLRDLLWRPGRALLVLDFFLALPGPRVAWPPVSVDA